MLFARCAIVVLLCLLLLGACGETTSTVTLLPPTPTPTPLPPAATQVSPTASPSPSPSLALPTPSPVVPPPLPDMVLVEAGRFEMGSAAGRADEQPVHWITLTRAFYVGRYEVTFAEYDLFCGGTVGVRCPSDNGWGRGERPATNVTWYDAVAYCNWLSEQHGLTPCYNQVGKNVMWDRSCDGYRLPTEAEWEYAARGGPLGRGFLYAGSDDPEEVAWYADPAGASHPVGQKQPNDLGLYDMSGNLWEWCWDFYNETFYARSPENDPAGPGSGHGDDFWGLERSRRGGSFHEEANVMRTSYRSFDGSKYVGPVNGFRLVRTAYSEPGP